MPAQPKPYAEGEVLNAVRQGRFINDGGSIRAPDIAENGETIPAEINLSTPLRHNECVYLFVDGRYLSHKACTKGNVRLSMLGIRVKMPATGNLSVAIAGNDGDIHSFAKQVRVTVGASPESQNNTKGGLDAKVRSYADGSQGFIKMLINSPMTTTDYLKKTIFRFGPENSVEVETTPWASRHPYIGVTVILPPGIYAFTSDLITNQGEAVSLQGGFQQGAGK